LHSLWEYKKALLSISKLISKIFLVLYGSTLLVRNFQEISYREGFDQADVNSSTVYLKNAFVPVTVQTIFSNPNGKFGTDINSGILMEYGGTSPKIPGN
jgi:hypothetical protein